MTKGPIFVTGMDHLMGMPIARALAGAGFDLVLDAEDRARLDDIAAELRRLKVRVHAVGAGPSDALWQVWGAVCASLPDPASFHVSALGDHVTSTSWSEAFEAAGGAPRLLMSARGRLPRGGRVVVLRGVLPPGEDWPLLRAALQAADTFRIAAAKELDAEGIDVVTVDVPLLVPAPVPGRVASWVVAVLKSHETEDLVALRELEQGASAVLDRTRTQADIESKRAEDVYSKRRKELVQQAISCLVRGSSIASQKQVSIMPPGASRDAITLVIETRELRAPKNVGTSIKPVPITLDEAIERIGPDPIAAFQETMRAIFPRRPPPLHAPTVPTEAGSSPATEVTAIICGHCTSKKRIFKSVQALEDHTCAVHGRAAVPASAKDALGPRGALIHALQNGMSERQDVVARIDALLTWANAETADGDLVHAVLHTYRGLLTDDDRSYVVAMAVVYHLRLPQALIEQYLPSRPQEGRWAWKLFESEEARWLDMVRSGKMPPGNGAGSNRSLYARALELVIRISSGGAYNPVIDQLLEPHGSRLIDDVLAGARERATGLGPLVTQRMSGFDASLWSVCVRRVPLQRYRCDHCWCRKCGGENLYATYENGAKPANVCAWCGWIICSQGSCQDPRQELRFDFRTGARLPPGRCGRVRALSTM